MHGLAIYIQSLEYPNALTPACFRSTSNLSATLCSPRNTRSIPPRPLTILSNYISPYRHQQQIPESRRWKQQRNVVNQPAMLYGRREPDSRRDSEPCKWQGQHCLMISKGRERRWKRSLSGRTRKRRRWSSKQRRLWRVVEEWSKGQMVRRESSVDVGVLVQMDVKVNLTLIVRDPVDVTGSGSQDDQLHGLHDNDLGVLPCMLHLLQ